MAQTRGQRYRQLWMQLSLIHKALAGLQEVRRLIVDELEALSRETVVPKIATRRRRVQMRSAVRR